MRNPLKIACIEQFIQSSGDSSLSLRMTSNNNSPILFLDHDLPAFAHTCGFDRKNIKSACAFGQIERHILNTFSYTCGFSVCAALAGWTSTSLDLSRKYLEWGRRNFQANHLDDTAHEFFHGDSLDWMNRWRKKGRQFDAVILDPPTFSRSKEHGDFRVERDYSQLTELALQILKPGGILFASANTIRLPAEKFLGDLQRVIAQQKRTILNELYVPQPVDFPIISGTPGYLKTVWLRIQ